jgi:RNA polymerase sigma-70 factor (ECF subfamily)
MDDQTLVSQITNGNTNAFRYLVDNNRKLVWHLVLRMVNRAEEAEDICQDVFLRVFRDIGKFRGESKLSTWIGSIAYHICIDHIRKNKREVVMSLESFTPALLQQISPVDRFGNHDRQMLRSLVHRIIDAMPVHYRTVVTLFHLEGLPYREISEITGMPEGTIKSYLNRGRQIIHDKMLELVPDIKPVLFETEKY